MKINDKKQYAIDSYMVVRKVVAHPLLYPVRRLNVSMKTLVRSEPSLSFFYQPYLLWERLNQMTFGGDAHEAIVDAETNILIDGYEGSANSFATNFFKASQSKPVRLVHHTHAPVQIIKAVQLNIPVLLVIREPKGASLSLTSRWPFISMAQALQRYIRFYTKLEPYLSHCVLSPFEKTTKNLDQVIQAVNLRYGTNFDVVNMDKASSVYRKMDRTKEEEAEYQTAKQYKLQKLSNPRNQMLLKKAEALYRTFEASV